MMAFKYNELEKLTDEQLKQAYDLLSKNTVVGLDFYREEIARREADAFNNRLSVLTNQMRNMTIVIVILTMISTVLVGISLWR